MKILLIGLGGFGKNHLRIWNELQEELYATDLDPKKRERCKTYHMAADHVSGNYKDFIKDVDAVDIVTPTDSHFELCKEALEAGKDVFVEKPFTSTAAQADELRRLAEKNKKIVQLGHIFRYNPATRELKRMIAAGELGKIRYIYGTFAGFKRMRTDVGVTQTDSIHYFDTVNYLLGAFPDRVLSVQRDTTGRGLEDISITLLDYGKTLVKVESGYHHPVLTRDLVVIGEKRTVEASLVKQSLRIHNNSFVRKKGVWIAVNDGVSSPSIVFEEPLRNELVAFRDSVDSRQEPLAGPLCGWETLTIVEAARESAKKMAAVELGAAAGSPG